MIAQQLPSSAVSFVIVDPDSGRVIMSQNKAVPRSPASTIKTVTTFAALDMLGPAYTCARTKAWISGREFDLLQGGGDPYMTLERWWSFVQALARLGLEVDTRRYRRRQHGIFAAAGRSRRLRRPAEPHLQRVAGCLDRKFSIGRVQPGRERADTRAVDVTATPAPVNLAVENHIRFAAGRCSGAAGRVDFQVDPAWDRVVFSGALSPHSCTAEHCTRTACACKLCVRHLRRAVAPIRRRVLRKLARRAHAGGRQADLDFRFAQFG